MGPFTGLFSPGDAKLEAAMHRALEAGDAEGARAAYCKLFASRVRGGKAQLLSELVLMAFPPKGKIPPSLPRASRQAP